MRKTLLFILSFTAYLSFAQIDTTFSVQKEVYLQQNELQLDSVSISPYNFRLYTIQQKKVDSTAYRVDFAKAVLRFTDTINLAKKYIVHYYKLPRFLTKTYRGYDKRRILKNQVQDTSFVSTKALKQQVIPFDGLHTKGFFARGITAGNNQDMVVNSALDLQISGKIKDGVTLRAVLRDDNLPRQQIGYSENIKEFDEVFMELKAKKWLARGGDILLKNQDYFLDFEKKIQGVSFNYQGKHTTLKTVGALVKGQYGEYVFQGEEGNQGPYKIKGKNNELYLLLVTDSEQVYANGKLLSRGENEDYRIDYQNAEIIFNPSFAIGNKDRITVTYQYTDRSYTRLVTYAKAAYKQKKWAISTSVFTENDAKNSPLQQELNDLQKQRLAAAGDNESLMQAPSALASAYSENKILYKKISTGTAYYYEFSNNPNDELYFVRFSNVGTNNGAYEIQSTEAIGTIYTYVGNNNGSYEPSIRLIAPNKLQVVNLEMAYHPSEKTSIHFSGANSNYDKNLFSTNDDLDNKANAFKLRITQVLLQKKWKTWFKGSYEQLQSDFKTVARLKKIDFNYKWNIQNHSGQENFVQAGIYSTKDKNNMISYEIQQLKMGTATNGINHKAQAAYQYKKIKLALNTNQLASTSALEDNSYNNLFASIAFNPKKTRYRVSYQSEMSKRIAKDTQLLNPLSRGFSEVETTVLFGKKSSKNILISYAYILNDSIKNNALKQRSKTNSYSIKTQFLQDKLGSGSLFVNYRNSLLNETNQTINTLNSKIVFDYKFIKKLITSQTNYSTFSGKLPQQEFTFIAAQAGLGYYKWNDYNQNNIQELDEFEVAQFQDEADYIRVLLPTKTYINTFQNKFSQRITINPNQWGNSNGKIKHFLAKFYNQSQIIIDKKERLINNNFKLNPFELANDNAIALLYSFQNNLYFNRGKQHYSLRYQYLESNTKTLLSIGLQEQYIQSNSLFFKHKINAFWQIALETTKQNSKRFAENNTSANHQLKSIKIIPKIHFKASKKTVFTLFYSLQEKNNNIGAFESLKQKQLGLKLHHQANKKFSLDITVDLYNNDFIGNSNSPVAYQMLSGLQKGKNQVWQFLLHRKINSFMDLNINYSGRKSALYHTIHNGSIQLKAYF